MIFLSNLKLFFCGGLRAVDYEVPYVYIFDFRNDSMTRKTDMNVSRTDHALEVDNNVVYAFGGESDYEPTDK